jgi:hypothetical protein
VKEIFNTPVEMFEFIDTFKDFLVSLRIKVIGSPYSEKFINPKYTVLENGKFIEITSDNYPEPQTFPLFMLEEIKIKWELFGETSGQRMVVTPQYFVLMMIPELRKVYKEFETLQASQKGV